MKIKYCTFREQSRESAGGAPSWSRVQGQCPCQGAKPTKTEMFSIKATHMTLTTPSFGWFNVNAKYEDSPS